MEYISARRMHARATHKREKKGHLMEYQFRYFRQNRVQQTRYLATTILGSSNAQKVYRIDCSWHVDRRRPKY